MLNRFKSMFINNYYDYASMEKLLEEAKKALVEQQFSTALHYCTQLETYFANAMKDACPSQQVLKKFAEMKTTLGMVYSSMKQYNNACDAFASAIKVDPDNATAKMGLEYAKMGLECAKTKLDNNNNNATSSLSKKS